VWGKFVVQISNCCPYTRQAFLRWRSVYQTFPRHKFASRLAVMRKWVEVNIWESLPERYLTIKADSHIACRAHAVLLPCRAAKSLECVLPLWFTQCGPVWLTPAIPCPCLAHAMLWPCRSSQGHSTERPSRDSLWATCPLSASPGYHAEFHEGCYQKHTNPPHNDPYLWL